MRKYRTDHGKDLVRMMQEGTIQKDVLSDHGRKFHGGYEQLYLEQFCTYLGSVSRHLQNQRIRTKKYTGE